MLYYLTVPPNIVDEGTVVDSKVKEKHNISLTCEASGGPCNTLLLYVDQFL